MDQADIPALLQRLASDEDATRKMAVFKLQTSINDPAFADVFISAGGLVVLRRLIMSSAGNTLAYSLQSLGRLLEIDMGWDIFEGPTATDLVERVVELIVTNPLVNILRGAMSCLVALVNHSQSGSQADALWPTSVSFGFRALKPAVAVYPQFFDFVVHQLQSADHALCANALLLVNALIRDAVSNSSPTVASTATGEEWVRLIKRLQDLGLVDAVYGLMRSSALHDLAHPLLEFQSLSRILVRKWREIPVDLDRSEHRRSLKGVHLASAPGRAGASVSSTDGDLDSLPKSTGPRKHNPEKWRRLGFKTESPAQEFEATGYLGLMDLYGYVQKHEGTFQRLLDEQATRPLAERCPIARASLAVTLILHDLFEIEKAELEETKGTLGIETGDYDKLFRPLLLQWSGLHAAGLHAFFRLWKTTGARQNDIDKVAELTRVLIEQVVGQAMRTKGLDEVEDEMQEYETGHLRGLQMELFELAFEDTWGRHLDKVREVLEQEALQFVKEQRARCLLQGSWFRRTKMAPETAKGAGPGGRGPMVPSPWRFARLSHNRRFLHYADFEKKPEQDPCLDDLAHKVDLSVISSVVSNIFVPGDETKDRIRERRMEEETKESKVTTKITIYGRQDGGRGTAMATSNGEVEEEALLTLWPVSHSSASEWLDGLLMLLNQAPITAETSKLVSLVSDYGLKIRLLNVRLDSAFEGPPPGTGVVPSREGLDEDYYFEV